MPSMEDIRVERLKLWAEGIPQGPVSIHIDSTNRCNVRCVFCWMRSHERMGLLDTKNELPDRQLLSTVNEAAQMGVVDWLISGGGEPLLRNVTVDMMEIIKHHRMAGDIITNGTLLTENSAKRIVKCGWDRIRISILGPNAGVHDNLSGSVGSFAKAMRALHLIKSYKNKMKTELPEIGFNTVISSGNYRHFPEIVELLADVGGTNLNTQTIILYSDEERWTTLDNNMRTDFRKYAERALRIALKHNIRTNLQEYLSEELVEKSTELGKMTELMKSGKGFGSCHCYEPFYLLTIRANGIAGSCRLFGNHGTDLHDRKLKEVWFGEYFSNARRRFLKGDIPDYCKHCNANEFVENRKIGEELKKRMENG